MPPYDEFLAAKAPSAPASGLSEVEWLPDALKPFQRAIVTWALRRGKAALFEGTGLGKTLQQLSWARVVADETQAPVLILTPLAVAEQTVAEAAKFRIEGVNYAADRSRIASDIVVTNYERFEKFDIGQFAGVVLDESGIIKSQDGATRMMLTEACAQTPWRLCCTATPAPNDYTELGQHAEFLGVMTAKEMLSMYFVHDGSIRADDHSQTNDGWRLKRHATRDFWRWLASWCVMVRHPRDLGFDDPEYDLPSLELEQITVAADYEPTGGMLFPMAAQTLGERIGVRRDTVDDRIKAAIDILRDVTCQTDQHLGVGGGKQTNTDTRLPTKRETRKTPQDVRATHLTASTANSLSLRTGGANHLYVGEQICSPDLECHRRSLISSDKSRAADAQFAALHQQTPPENHCASITATTSVSCEGFSARPATQGSDISKTIETSCSGLSSILPKPQESWIIWCKLNKEQEKLENILKEECFSVYGSLPPEEKVFRIQGWLRKDRPILLTKPKICGWGLNMQISAKMIFVGATDSFEEIYQSLRRSWRFGQKRQVKAWFIASELEGAVVANLSRKERAFDAMLDAMSDHMRDLMREQIFAGRVASDPYNPQIQMRVPTWLTTEAA